jgi:hypothetical protein
MSAKTYIVYNGAMVTTAAPVKQPTGAAIRTMMQIIPNVPIRITEWAASFDGYAPATPGIIELIDTGTVAAVITNAYAAADIQPYGDANAPANTAGASGIPLSLGTTSLSGYASAAGTENTPTATRMGGLGQIAPTNQYEKQMPLSREFEVPPGHVLRVRATFPSTVNMLCYVLFEV